MARRLGDRLALGYALNARMHALWGIGPAPERLATGTELGEIADDVGDEFLALHGHMWRVRELLAQGDVEAVNEEMARFEARDTGPVHPLDAAFGFNVGAMMALVAGDIEQAEWLGRRRMEVAEGYNDLAATLLRGAHGVDVVATGRARSSSSPCSKTSIAQAPTDYPSVSAALALIHAEAGETETALEYLDALARSAGSVVAKDQTEGVSLALAAAACGTLGEPARDVRPEHVRSRCVPMPARPW